MSYPDFRAAPPTPPNLNPNVRASRAGDVAVSIVLLVVSAVGWVVAASMEFLVLAFTDYCPPEHCSAQRASVTIVLSVSVAAAAVVLGSVIAVAQMIRRRPAWPFAAAALALSLLAEALGFVGYFAAVGY